MKTNKQKNEKGHIEDQTEALHADFANEYIGGGVLHGGNVQEEIYFSVFCECLVACVIAPQPMQVNESIIILGFLFFFVCFDLQLFGLF